VLATAGALLLAVTALQIAQQVLSVFSPRPSIQVATIIAVGLAALTAERLRAGAGTDHADRVAIAAGLGCVAALGVAGAVWLGAGFSTPQQASIGAQVDDVRAQLRRDGFQVAYRKLRLHQGGSSRLFVLTPGPARERRSGRASDELLLYDAVHGKLRRALAFRPQLGEPGASAGAAYPASFHIWSVRDIDGDGQQEVLASYETNMAGAEYQRVPIMLTRQVATGRYSITPVLAVRALGPAASSGLPTYTFGPVGGARAESVWVGELALDAGRLFAPEHTILATSVVMAPGNDPRRLALTVEPGAAGGRRAVGIPTHVRFWDLDLRGARPVARPLCLLGTGRTVVRVAARMLDSRAFLGRALSDAMHAAQVGLGELIDGRCVDAAS
jgi:hypothetical protein